MITPAIDSAEHTAEAVNAAPSTTPGRTESARVTPDQAFPQREAGFGRVSRASARRAVTRPPAAHNARRPAILAAVRAVRRAGPGAARGITLVRPAAVRRLAAVTRAGRSRTAVLLLRTAARPAVRQRRTVRAVTRHLVAPSTRRVNLVGGMSAVIAYARAQVGKRYVTGGEGSGGFDCSGLTKRAYARAGIRLPHSSGAQSSRARTVSRSQARPGDLVMGPGHVGIYMGHGMMIDAGNHRTGVVYRKLYSGLRVGRL